MLIVNTKIRRDKVTASTGYIIGKKVEGNVLNRNLPYRLMYRTQLSTTTGIGCPESYRTDLNDYCKHINR